MREWLRDALGLGEGETPFPWQEDLLELFMQGVIPQALDIPTGLGKTAVMAIWLVARARGAKLPRRLVYVVDRRAVVDQATEVALELRQLVDRNRNLKQNLGLDDKRSLPISTLRGQHVDNREWLEDPASPAIIVGTVDMIGSRLLFEGYGVSRKMRPYHAGLLGADTLVVIDEAHLVPPFEQILRAIADDVAFDPRERALQEVVPSFKLLPLSATGRTSGPTLFGLTPRDLEHPIIWKRLHAKKQLRVDPLDKEAKLEEEMARHAWELCCSGERAVRCIVFCDERRVAEKAKGAVEKLADGDKKAGKPAVRIDTELFVGGRRVFEREQAKEWLQEHGFIAGRRVERTRPAFLFATSAGEVGVDLDAEHMVCDLVAWERMVQRLGRVNRRGEPEDHVAHGDVIIEPEPEDIEDLLKKNPSERTKKERDIVDQVERTRAARRLAEQLPPKDGDRLDASPGALRDLKRRADADRELCQLLTAATTPVPLRPALSRALVDAWSMTSLENHTGRPIITPWLRGWIEGEPSQTGIVWRTYLPVRTGGVSATRKEIEAFFEAAPPHASELLETETFRVVEWLTARAEALLSLPSIASREESSAEGPHLRPEDAVVFVLAPDGALRRPLRLTDIALPEDARIAKDRRDKLHDALAGAMLVVDARLGGLRDGLLDADAAGIPRSVDDGNAWLGEGVIRFRVRSLDATEASTWDKQWRERLRFAADLSEDGEARRWLIIEKWRHDGATEEDRSAARPQLLDQHVSWAEERARKLATELSLNDYVEMLAVAARLHDEGKRARRWQRAFNGPPDGVYAKTRGPINHALLNGYRHELASMLHAKKDERLLALSEEQRELALHLIAAHHGFSRPVIGTSGCEDAPPSALEDRAGEISLRFARLQEHWGPWGLAWWEALLRAADQLASRDNDALEDTGGGV